MMRTIELVAAAVGEQNVSNTEASESLRALQVLYSLD
jgi:hypothetical protein